MEQVHIAPIEVLSWSSIHEKRSAAAAGKIIKIPAKNGGIIEILIT